jgi:hypothetical protein
MKHQIIEQLPEDAKPIPGYAKMFATPAGEIISTRRGRPRIRFTYPFHGHARINIKDSGVEKCLRVTQLIAVTFHGPRPSKQHSAIHRNGVRTDNRASNVLWAIPAERSAITVANGTQAKGETHAQHVLTEREVIKMRREGFSLNQLAVKFGVCKGTIGHISAGTTWRHLLREPAVSPEMAALRADMVGGRSSGHASGTRNGRTQKLAARRAG